MRKGDEKRQELLNVAEKLFCQKGYEATSVQDILNVLHISKGGFYHHFASKEELLNTLFIQRAEQSLVHLEEALAGETDIMTRLNLLLYGYLPLRQDEADFVAMLLPMMDKPEGRALRLCYQEILEEVFQPALQRELALAQDAKVIFPACGDLEDVILHLMARCWADVASLLLKGAKTAQKPDAAALLGCLGKYRRVLERLLDAPYGSVKIIDLQEWDETADALLRRLNVAVQ